MNLEILYGFMAATTALAISPGPDNIFVMMQSMVHGKKYGMAVVLGLITGCLVHTTLVAFGVSTIIQQSEVLFLSIKIIGAMYLFYLAIQVFKSEPTINFTENHLPKKTTLQLYKQGFFMNVLNPKVSIFFLAFFPSFLFSTSIAPVIQFYILGILFMLISFMVFSILAISAGYLSQVIKKNTQIGWYVKWLQIIVFIGIGVFILLSEK